MRLSCLEIYLATSSLEYGMLTSHHGMLTTLVEKFEVFSHDHIVLLSFLLLRCLLDYSKVVSKTMSNFLTALRNMV